MKRKKEPPAGSGFRRSISNNMFLLRIAWSEAPFFTLHSLLNSTKNRAAVFLEQVILTQYIVDAITNKTPFSEVLLLLGVTMVVLILTEQVYVQLVETRVQPGAQEKIERRIRMELFEKATQTDLACYDDPDYYTDFVWAMSEAATQVYAVMETIAHFLSSVAAIALSGTFLLTHDWTAILFVALSLVIMLTLTRVYNRLSLRLKEAMRPHERKRDYVARVMYLADHAKEIRLNNVKDRLYSDFHEAVAELEKEANKRTRALAALRIIEAFFAEFFLFRSVYLLYLLYQTLEKGLFGYGTMIGMFRAVNYLSGTLMGLSYSLPEFQQNSLYIEKIRRFLSYETKVTSPAKPQKLPEEPAVFELIDVCFSYQNVQVLNNVSMKIHPGERIALVGYNGAGKTTIVKLLMRLYDVDSGMITYNGTDIRCYSLKAYRRLFATVFQDFQLFAASIEENVTADSGRANARRFAEAVQRSGFDVLLKKMKKGKETQITKEFDDEGVELSGGEAQSLVISRALYQNSMALILDEPSSALDPLAEYNLHRQVMEENPEKTVILISHRLSTTRHADCIYMLEQGKIIESGTHDELMKEQGSYAEMFDLQAEKYR